MIDDRRDISYVQELRKYCTGLDYDVIRPQWKRIKTIPYLLTNKPLSVPYFYSKKLQNAIDRRLNETPIDAIICFSSPMAEYVLKSKSINVRDVRNVQGVRDDRNGKDVRNIQDVQGDRNVQNNRTTRKILTSGAIEQFEHVEQAKRLNNSNDSNIRGCPRLIMDFVDVDSDKWRMYADSQSFPFSSIYRREWKRLMNYEKKVGEIADWSLFVSEKEVELFKSFCPQARTMAIPNGVDFEFYGDVRDVQNVQDVRNVQVVRNEKDVRGDRDVEDVRNVRNVQNNRTIRTSSTIRTCPTSETIEQLEHFQQVEHVQQVKRSNNSNDSHERSDRTSRTFPTSGAIEQVEHSQQAERSNILFIGAMDYFPNEDAVLYFFNEIWPYVKKELPAAKFFVVGGNPSKRIKSLPGKDPHIVVTGYAPDVRPYLRMADVFVAPLRVARGIQNKVLEAMAAGVPVVARPEAVQGLHYHNGCIKVEEKSERFAHSVLKIIKVPHIRHKMVGDSRRFVLENHDWEKNLKKFEIIITGGNR